MLVVIFNVIFPVLLAVLAGFVWGRSGLSFDIRFVTRLVTYIGAPALIIATIDEADLVRADFFGLAQWSLLLLGGFAALGWLVFKLLGLNFKALSLPVIFPNTGNMGLPLCFFAFGEAGLAAALVVFVTVSLVHFGCGDLVLGEGKPLGRRLLGIVTEPIFCAAVIALLLVVSGWKLPSGLALALKSLGGMTIPLMLITLGVSLAQIVRVAWRKGWLISVLRVPGGLAVGLLVVNLFAIEGVAAKVLILQASMPAAVFNYFFALRHQKELETVASSVVISTFLSFLILPFLLWFLMDF